MNVIIYSKHGCPWCDRAKALLSQYKFSYSEKILNQDYIKEDLQLILGPEKKLTVPQIVIDDKLVGGYGDLLEYFENHFIFGTQT